MKKPIEHESHVLRTERKQIEYLPNISIEDYFLSFQQKHFRIFPSLELNLLDQNELYDFIIEMESLGGDFDGNSPNQRGEMYRIAQQNSMVRAKGIKQIFQFVCPHNNATVTGSGCKILDVLGGDGTLARAYKTMYPEEDTIVVTSDISGKMILEANLLGLPAIRQPSHRLLLKSNTIDGLIIAYGTHHIPKSKLNQTYTEAHRVLKPGGVVLAHDFDQDGPVSTWFRDVVQPWSKTGHDFPHFYPNELKLGLSEAGFEAVKEIIMYDPLCLQAYKPEDAQIELANYLINMYGLKKLISKFGISEARKVVLELAGKIFKYNYGSLELPETFGKKEISITESKGLFEIELPRLALVAYGKKI